MSSFVEKIRPQIDEYISKFTAAKIIVAISGGADSVALFRALDEILADSKVQLELVHINHQLRGEDSNADQKFVENLAQKFNVKLHIFCKNVADFSKINGFSIETAARKVRYDFLDKFENSALIATAHNANDNAETVLLNLARGTGLAGLCGVPAVRGHYIRPLLKISRDEIEQYLDSIKQDYVTDKTNFDEIYTRNNIRLNVLPQFLKMNSNFLQAIENLTNHLTDDENYLQIQAINTLKSITTNGEINAKMLAELPRNISYRIIKILMRNAGVSEFSHIHITLIHEILPVGGAVNLPGDLFARVQKNIFKITNR